MCLKELGFNAICGQSEHCTITAQQMAEFKSRFKYVIFFMDNDKAGVDANSKLSIEHKTVSMAVPNKKTSDISDFVAKFGKSSGYKVLKKIVSRSIVKVHQINDLFNY